MTQLPCRVKGKKCCYIEGRASARPDSLVAQTIQIWDVQKSQMSPSHLVKQSPQWSHGGGTKIHSIQRAIPATGCGT